MALIVGLAVLHSLTACGGGDVRPDLEASGSALAANSTDIVDLKAGLKELPFEVSLVNGRGLEKGGIVAGTVTDRGGVKSEFALKLGDGGTSTMKVVRRLNPEAKLLDIGRGFVNGVEYSFVLDGTGDSSDFDRRHRMRTAAIEKACVVRSGASCNWVGPPEESAE